MPSIGQFAALPVSSITDYGCYLDGAELGEILLPKKFIREGVTEGQVIEVFLYLDSNDRPIATTETPKATVGQVALLTITDVGRFGAFADWGLDKDVLIPFAEQKVPLEQGQRVLTYLYIDAIDHRITGSTKLDRFIKDDANNEYKAGQEVEVIIAGKTDLGSKAIVNHSHWGLLYQNEIFERLRYGQVIPARIRRVRSDGKLDLIIIQDQTSRDQSQQKILDFLKQNQGYAPFHDKSDPELIKRVFGMSKASFKKAIGGLFRNKQISIEKAGIRLLDE